MARGLLTCCPSTDDPSSLWGVNLSGKWWIEVKSSGKEGQRNQNDIFFDLHDLSAVDTAERAKMWPFFSSTTYSILTGHLLRLNFHFFLSLSVFLLPRRRNIRGCNFFSYVTSPSLLFMLFIIIHETNDNGHVPRALGTLHIRSTFFSFITKFALYFFLQFSLFYRAQEEIKLTSEFSMRIVFFTKKTEL